MVRENRKNDPKLDVSCCSYILADRNDVYAHCPANLINHYALLIDRIH